MRRVRGLLDALRSPRVAAWGTGLAALVVLVTVVAGGVGTARDLGRVGDVTVSAGPEPGCVTGLCTLSWDVEVGGGAVRLNRVALPGLGLAAVDERELRSVTLGSTAVTLPSREDRSDRDRTAAVIRPGADLEGGTRTSLRVTVAVPASCPPEGLGEVRPEVTVTSGGALQEYVPAAQPVPCGD